MTIVWAVLGAILITAVVAVFVVFFFVRPALAKKVTAASKTLAGELHGRPPLLSAPVSCEGTNDPGRADLKGIGVLALTEQALVFVAGDTQASVIIPIDNMISAVASDSFTAHNRVLKRSRPMLVVRWRVGVGSVVVPDVVEPAIAFTVDSIDRWIGAIPTAGLGGLTSDSR